MKLLLTGATGFVGRNLLLRCLAENKYSEIILPVRNPAKLEKQLKDEGYAESPTELTVIKAAAPQWRFPDVEVDHVVHGAGTLSGRTYEDYRSTNCDGTVELLRRVPRSARTLILSSQAASGPTQGATPKKENEEQDCPVTWYGKSKLAMEGQVTTEFPEHSYLILRPPIILGPRDTDSLPLFKMAKQIVRFKPGFGTKHYSFLSVGDLGSAIFAALEAPAEQWAAHLRKIYYVTHPRPISDIELIEGAGNAIQKTGPLLPVPHFILWLASRVIEMVPRWREAIPTLSKDRAHEIWPANWTVQSGTFEEAFGWEAKETLEETLKATAAWYKKTGELS